MRANTGKKKKKFNFVWSLQRNVSLKVILKIMQKKHFLL